MDPVQCEHMVAEAAAEERTCPVCLEEIDRARVLDCGHCMCDTCAARYCRNLLGRRRRDQACSSIVVGPVPCPKCRDVSLVAMDTNPRQGSDGIGLPETGKLSALVAVCRGFANNPGLFLGIDEEEEENGAGDSTDPCCMQGGVREIETRLQSCLQATGTELSQLAEEARSLREEIRARAADSSIEEDAGVDAGEASAADVEEAEERAGRRLIAHLSGIFSGPADRLIRRQEAARFRLEAAWLRLRSLQFARGCYGNAFLGNFSKAWRAVAIPSPEVKRAADPAEWDQDSMQLRRDSFVLWAVVSKDATGDSSFATATDPDDVKAALSAAGAKLSSPMSGAGQERLVQPRLLWRVGSGGEGPLEFRWPVHASFVSGDRVAVCDKNNYRVQMLSVKDGAWLGYLGSGCVKPRRILESKNGNFYICDETAACVKVFNKDFALVDRLGEGVFQCPSGIGETKSGNLVLTDLDHAFVVTINPDTKEIVKKFHTRLHDDVYIPSPHFVTMDEDDFIVVSDSLNNTVKIFDPRGRISGRIRGFNCPRGLALDHHGNILVVNADTHSVSLFTYLGKHLQDVLCADDGLNFPMSAAFNKERRQLLLTQCSVYGRYEVLLFQLDYIAECRDGGVRKKSVA